jgi:hypothetical protein
MGRSSRPAQRLLAPGIPVHRVVRVLEQVGARLPGEPVGTAILAVPAHWPFRASSALAAKTKSLSVGC